MLQLNNKTPFAASMALFPNPECIDTMYIMVKATFNIGSKWTLIDEQIPPVEADVYWGEPESSSIRYASDYHTGKPSTDIVMTGLACAHGQQMVNQLEVGLSVGKVSKSIRVFGDRQWIDGRISEPAPFQAMPLVYEKSFGGMHLVDGEIDSADARNPLGCGFAGNRSANQMNGVPLPNLEDPNDLITKHMQTPMPACFGYSSPAWEPRVNYVGTYDESWQSQRAPYLPEDFDSRFFNMAHPDLVYPGYLQGGEAVSITGMHPGGELNFELPKINLTSQFKLREQVDSAKFHLETLHIEPNLLQLSMIWRAEYPCDKKALKVEEVKVGISH